MKDLPDHEMDQAMTELLRGEDLRRHASDLADVQRTVHWIEDTLRTEFDDLRRRLDTLEAKEGHHARE